MGANQNTFPCLNLRSCSSFHLFCGQLRYQTRISDPCDCCQHMRAIVYIVALAVAVSAFNGERKPSWPEQFDIPFGLSILAHGAIPAVGNASSHMYYNWNELQ